VTPASTRIQNSGPKIQTIAYEWKNYGVKVAFQKQDGDKLWLVTIRDSWDILDDSGASRERRWGEAEAKCSMDEFLVLLEQSLNEFHRERPGAKFSHFAVEMHVIAGIWSELLVGVKRRLATVEGTKTSSRADVPREVDDEIKRILASSLAVMKLESVLAGHGLKGSHCYVADELVFKDSLSGLRWAEIAKLPDLGVLAPGVLEFEFASAE